jgi:alpha-D-ribose 1-methylphosphonate 5-triphosphate diphosphatase
MDAWIAKHKESQRRHAGVNRKRVLELARARSVALGSHDDATPDHIREAAEDRMSFTEFPTTEAAAVEARLQGIDILLGAPNVVRGKSHSGNASALDLARVGLLDILSSDYVPSSLMYAVVILHRMAGLSLPRAVATATRNPARLLGLDDRGEIAIGRRADLVRVNDGGEVPVIRTVWRAGERVA